MKLLMALLLISSFTFNPVPGQVGYITEKSVTVFETASFSNPLMQGEEKVKLNDGENVVFIETSADDPDFVKVSFKYNDAELEGFVYQGYLTFNEVEQELFPNYNATVISDTVIYDMNFEPTDYTVKAGQGVYLYQGYSNDKFLAVTIPVTIGEGEEARTILYRGYIKNEFIATKGVNAELITGIVVIASCLTVIFILLFMKKKKRQ